MLPTARVRAPWRTAWTETTSSGSEVATAVNRLPTKVSLMGVRSAISAPARAITQPAAATAAPLIRGLARVDLRPCSWDSSAGSSGTVSSVRRGRHMGSFEAPRAARRPPP